MAWLALVVFWFGATTLLGPDAAASHSALVARVRRDWLPQRAQPRRADRAGDLAPDRRGPSRPKLGQRPFDYQYTLRLSADAVPALVEGIGEVSPAARAAVARDTLQRWGPQAAPTDWRTWNWGRWRAAETVRQNEESLKALTR
jgi:hypothetical protein